MSRNASRSSPEAAMAGMGPPPKHPSQRRRRNSAPGMIQLPAEGRKGRAPKWPLRVRLDGEAELWSELWKTPQAVAWERLGWTRIVARYVGLIVLLENLPAKTPMAPLLAEVRQIEDRLGLTPLAMRRLGWEIVADELAERREPPSMSTPKPQRARVRAFDAKLATDAG